MSRCLKKGWVAQALASVVLGIAAVTPMAVEAATTWVPPAWVAQGRSGGVLRMVNAREPDHWDLHRAAVAHGPAAARDLFNGLLMYNPVQPGEIVGDLAKSWEISPDGMRYTFSLYDAQWWDGKPVTADDVKFSLDRMLETGQSRPRVGALRHYIARMEVIDAHTVRLHTKFPRPAALLHWLAMDYAVIYPKHVSETGVDFDDPKHIVGSGPFKFKSYQRGQGWEVVKNPNYFKKGLPFLDGVQVFVIRDATRTIAAFQAEQVLMCTPNSNCVYTIKNLLELARAMEGKGDFYWMDPTNPVGLMLNYTKPPFDDPRVRRAVYLAIDRQELIQVAALGKGVVGTPFFPNTWMSSPMEEVLTWPGVRQPKDADLAEAKKLLADAGHPDGFKTSYLSYPPYEDMAVVIKQQLKKIGIDAELRAVDANTAFAAQARGDYAISGILHGPTILDPDEIFQCCYLPGGPRNQLGWEHARVTALYEQQARESDQAMRRALTLQAEALIRQGETSWMTLYWGTFGNLVHRQVKNFHLPLSPHQANTHEHLWLEAR